MNGHRDSSRLTGVLWAIVTTAGSLVRCRLQLFATEVQEEKARLVRLLVLAVAAVFAGVMSVLFLSLTIVFVTAEEWRWAVLALLTVFYAAASGALFVAIRRGLRRQKIPFARTIRELGGGSEKEKRER